MGIGAQIVYITNGCGKVQHLEEINVDTGRKKMRNRLVDRLVDKAEVLERYGELYEIFDDSREIQKEIDKIYDKINDLPYVEVKAIPIEWIEKQMAEREDYGDFNTAAAIGYLLLSWEKENERT